MEHPAVAEAGVIGKPDAVVGELVKAFVVLRPGSRADRRAPARADRLRPRRASARRSPPRSSSSATTSPRPEAARSCAGCYAPASSGYPTATSRRWSPEHEPRRSTRTTHATSISRCCASAGSRNAASSSTAPPRSAGSCTSTSARRRSPSGSCRRSAPEDAVVATYREHGHALARGVPADSIMAEMFGKVEGCSRGRGGSMHLFDASTRFYGGNAIVGGGLPLAVGLALADKMESRPRVTACFFGEGAVAEGEFHESMNLAALWDLPVLFCCENNLYAMGTALDRSESEIELTLKAASYEMPAWSSTAWTCSRSSARLTAPRPRCEPAPGRTSSSCGPTGSAPIRCTTRSCTATRPRSSAGSERDPAHAVRAAPA